MHGANYRRGNGQPYARKKYIKGKPQIKIAKFQSGKPDNYDYCVQLLVNEKVQKNKTIEKVAGENYQKTTDPHVLLQQQLVGYNVRDVFCIWIQRRKTGKNFNTTGNVRDGKKSNHCGNRAARGNNILQGFNVRICTKFSMIIPSR